MEIKDQRIVELLKKHYCRELEYRLDTYSDDPNSIKDLSVMSELEYIKRELKWIIEDFEDPEHSCYEDLQNALELKKASKNFKENLQANKIEYDQAKDTIQEYKNAKKLQKELAKL